MSDGEHLRSAHELGARDRDGYGREGNEVGHERWKGKPWREKQRKMKGGRNGRRGCKERGGVCGRGMEGEDAERERESLRE